MAISFLKKKPKAPPIERVKELSSRGFSEIEIIDVLRKEGYSPNEIDLALSQVLKESIEKTIPPENKPPQQQTLQQQKESTVEVKESKSFETIESQFQPTQQSYSYDWEDFISYIDYLIENRVSEIVNQIKILEAKYNQIEKGFMDIKTEFREDESKRGEFERNLLRKIETLDKNIAELSRKIETLEEIFKEILPSLIDSIRMLSSLVKQKEA